ncbi:MAG: redox-sensing transcriptional repressor Rex, partial [Streptococcus gallolyticus]|nr:redox-sensing transcriptional repressor Rex [Streptococcus gallolyticus]
DGIWMSQHLIPTNQHYLEIMCDCSVQTAPLLWMPHFFDEKVKEYQAQDPNYAGFGYDVKQLMNFFADILNDHSTTNVLLVGCGNIGRALLHYRFHDRNKMQIAMAFDTDDNEMVGHETSDGIPIYGISSLKKHAQEAGIETAILTVPSSKAQEVADVLVDAGIHGILSFSPVHLNVPKGIIVQYVDLTSELQTLLYFMNQSNQNN